MSGCSFQAPGQNPHEENGRHIGHDDRQDAAAEAMPTSNCCRPSE